MAKWTHAPLYLPLFLGDGHLVEYGAVMGESSVAEHCERVVLKFIS